METSLIIAVLSLLGVVIKSIYDYYQSKKTDSAIAHKLFTESNRIEYDTAINLVNTLKKEVDSYKKELEELRKIVKELRTTEESHMIEKLKLEGKIELLISENLSLRQQIEQNKLQYEDEIKILKEEIKKLQEKIK